MATTNHETTLINGLLNAVTLTDSTIVKTAAYNPEETINGNGVLTVEITNREQAYPGQPIYFVSVSVMGLTFASEDGQQTRIRQMFDDTLKSVQGWTASTLSTTVGLTIDGILPVTTAAIRGSADRFTFSVDFQIAMSNVTF